ncbi:ATP-binding protein [Sutcliffiella horikoshii]|uniref:ATP-binding protein n=1 Tax=Sutcliffiella horikoshii TaxID=79883 RepID=UPI003CFB8A5D
MKNKSKPPESDFSVIIYQIMKHAEDFFLLDLMDNEEDAANIKKRKQKRQKALRSFYKKLEIIKQSNLPDSQKLFKLLGVKASFDQMLNFLEVTDNAMSATRQKVGKGKVYITINMIDSNHLLITIEDNGIGMDAKDLIEMMRIGGSDYLKSSQSFINLFGSGFISYVSSFDSENLNWLIASRTDADKANNKYHFMKAPYSFTMIPRTKNGWPGLEDTNTLVQVKTMTSEFSKILNHYHPRNTYPNSKDTIIKAYQFLKEALGFYYADLIDNDSLEFNTRLLLEEEDQALPFEYVKAVQPTAADVVEASRQPLLDENGKQIEDLEIDFRAGYFVHKNENFLFWKHTMKFSGYIQSHNGRRMIYGEKSAIWPNHSHPSYNGTYYETRLFSEKKDAFPPTNSSKSKIDFTKHVQNDVIRFVKNQVNKLTGGNMVSPLKKEDVQREASEDEKVKEFIHTHKDIYSFQYKYKGGDSEEETDLVFIDKETGQVFLLEAKKDVSKKLNLYQLMMYWDDHAKEIGSPYKAFLVAESHANSVKEKIHELNGRLDGNNNPYSFAVKTWKDLGVPNEKKELTHLKENSPALISLLTKLDELESRINQTELC